jgi:hypothetical protein
MSKITLNPEALLVESFEPAPGPGDAPAAWTEWDCGTYDCLLTGNYWAYTCGADVTCQYYNCDD